MSDVIEHLDNPKNTFKNIFKIMNKNSKLIITMANPLWEPILMIGEKLKFKMPEGPHKRIDFKSIEKIVNRCGLKVISHDYKLLIPIEIPLVTSFINKYFEKPLRRLAFIEYFIAVKF